MTRIKIKFRPSSINIKEGTLFYQVTHKRVSRQIKVGYKLFPDEWENLFSNETICNRDEQRKIYLTNLKIQIEADIRKLERIITELEQKGNGYTSDEVVRTFRSMSETNGFFSFTGKLINQLSRVGRFRTAETYTTVLNSLMRFRENREIPLEDLDTNLMMAYESYLKSTGLCPNSTSFYLRNIRAIYNRAVSAELTEQRSPFKYVYTGIEKTIKRAIPLNVIRKIKELDLNSYPAMDYARDMFLFSFYTRGMSFIDMAYLKKTDLVRGILSYRRKKTGQRLNIKWEKVMQGIVDKYDTSGSPYLLPIIKNLYLDDRRQYKTVAHSVNKNLKAIGERLETSIPLTMYVARHTWASIAWSKNISLSVISEAMGHDSENTTRIYLASLDSAMIDKANHLILNSI